VGIDEGMPLGGVVDSSGNISSALDHATTTSVVDPVFATATTTVTFWLPFRFARTTTMLTDDTMSTAGADGTAGRPSRGA
jgi:hypothetical protein